MIETLLATLDADEANPPPGVSSRPAASVHAVGRRRCTPSGGVGARRRAVVNADGVIAAVLVWAGALDVVVGCWPWMFAGTVTPLTADGG